MPRPTIAAKTRTPSSARQLRRRAGIPNSRRPAIVTPPPTAKNLSRGRWRAPLVAAVEVIVIVVVTEPVPVMLTVDGIEQVGVLVAPIGLLVSEQLMLTVPVNPPTGLTVMVEVLPVVAPGVRPVRFVPATENPAAGFRVTGTLRTWLVVLPSVAVTSAV